MLVVVFTFLGEVLTNKYVARHFSNKQYNYYTIYYIILHCVYLHYTTYMYSMAIARYNTLYALHCATAAGQAQYSHIHVHVQEQRVSC